MAANIKKRSSLLLVNEDAFRKNKKYPQMSDKQFDYQIYKKYFSIRKHHLNCRPSINPRKMSGH